MSDQENMSVFARKFASVLLTLNTAHMQINEQICVTYVFAMFCKVKQIHIYTPTLQTNVLFR